MKQLYSMIMASLEVVFVGDQPSPHVVFQDKPPYSHM